MPFSVSMVRASFYKWVPGEQNPGKFVAEICEIFYVPQQQTILGSVYPSAMIRCWSLQIADLLGCGCDCSLCCCGCAFNAQASLPKLCRTFCGRVWGLFVCCKIRLVLPSCLLPPNLGKSRCTSCVLDIREYSVKPCRLFWKSELEVTPSAASEAVFQTEPAETGRVQMCNETHAPASSLSVRVL